MNNLRFKDLRKYFSQIDRFSVCTKETLSYENYRHIKDVPAAYDEYFIYGIGMIESEFPAEWIHDAKESSGAAPSEKTVLAYCIEIMVSKIPKE